MPCESTVEEVSFEWSHMFFIGIIIFLPGSQWSHGFFWFLNLKWFATSYWHHDSLVSCFCGSCSPQRLVHVLVEDHKTQENYMYKNQDNRKSHEKYQPWESGKPGKTESHRAKETKRTWEPQVPETRRSKRIRTRMLVKVNTVCQLSSPVSTKSCGSDLNNWYLARGSCCA